MALVHRATLAPSKQELVESWLPGQTWASGRTIVKKLGEYRFDDPAGEVGVETILWGTDDDSVVQTPLTYRARPLPGTEAHLIGTSQHSVLGERYVYDGCGDPVWACALASAIATGGTQAQMYFEVDGERVDVPPRVRVRGSGGLDEVTGIRSTLSVTDQGLTTVVRCEGVEIVLARQVGALATEEHTLTGLLGQGGTTVLAALRRR